MLIQFLLCEAVQWNLGKEERAFPWDRDAQRAPMVATGCVSRSPSSGQKDLGPNWHVFESRASKDQSCGLG